MRKLDPSKISCYAVDAVGAGQQRITYQKDDEPTHMHLLNLKPWQIHIRPTLWLPIKLPLPASVAHACADVCTKSALERTGD